MYRLAPTGFSWVALPLALACLLSWFAGLIWAAPFWIITFFLVWFFRDPDRESWESSQAIISPADGKVIDISASDTEGVFQSHQKISIFMNVFDVHVNRMPVAGTIRDVHHFAGKFLAAWDPNSSKANERTEITLDTSIGPVLVRLVAGLVARRIVTYVKPNQQLARCSRISMIKLGSRVDIYLPSDCRIEVGMGDVVLAGITRLATIQTLSANALTAEESENQ